MAMKRLQAMQAAAAAAAQTNQRGPRVALLPSVYDDSSASTSPRAGPADQQPLISYNCGDIDTEEADCGPTTNYVSFSFTFSQQPQLTFRLRQSHSHTAFSPDAKPFIPPGVSASTRTPAPVAANKMSPATMAPPRRLAPHHRLQGGAPASVPAVPASASPKPIVKTEPPASPSLSVRSHRPAPHTRLGPHVQKASATPQMQRPTQPAASTPVQNGVTANAQNTLVNLHLIPSLTKTLGLRFKSHLRSRPVPGLIFANLTSRPNPKLFAQNVRSQRHRSLRSPQVWRTFPAPRLPLLPSTTQSPFRLQLCPSPTRYDQFIT